MMSSIYLTTQEVADITGYRRRPDGWPIVSRVAFERVMGGVVSHFNACGVVADGAPLAGDEMHGLAVANLEKGAGSDQLPLANPDDIRGA
ncbi:MAG: DUF4224 domain-containing protein [Gammaproteobacteria bacterium]|nr:DUF4224 domain-containing protein [Gammaproteobacteria bacterium]